MQRFADSVDLNRRRLASLQKDQLVDLLANILATVDALADGDSDWARPLVTTDHTAKADVKLTKAWALILWRLSTYQHFRASDAVLESRELHKRKKVARIQTAGSARAQLCLLTRKRIIKRLGGGNYAVPANTKHVLARSDAVKKLGWSRADGSSPETAGDAR